MTGALTLIDSARPEDVAALLAIERECSSHPWTLEQVRKAVGSVAGEPAVLVLREGEQGRSATVAFCAFQVVADELHIHNLAVRPLARRQGHARSLLSACLAAGASRGARRALLEVRASNQEALALYGSLGFIRVGVRRAYYVQPEEDAVLLEKAGLVSPCGGAPSR